MFVLDEKVKEGDKVSVQVIEGKDSSSYSSYIATITSQGVFDIAVPYARGKQLLLPEGQRLKLFLQSVGGMQVCEAIISKRVHDGNMSLYRMELVTEVKKGQMRDSFRMPYAAKIGVRAMTEMEYDIMSSGGSAMGGEWDEAVTMDLSAGGMKFASKQQYEAGSFVYCVVNIETAESSLELEVPCEVLRAVQSNRYKGYCEHSVAFRCLGKKVKDKLYTILAVKQREMIKESR